MNLTLDGYPYRSRAYQYGWILRTGTAQPYRYLNLFYMPFTKSNVCDLYTGDSKENATFDGFGSFSTLSNPFCVSSALVFDATSSLSIGPLSTTPFGASNTEPCTVSLYLLTIFVCTR